MKYLSRALAATTLSITLIFSGICASVGRAFASPDTADTTTTSAHEVEVFNVSSDTIERLENSIPAARAVLDARSTPDASDPEHTENFTEENGIRLMLTINKDMLDQPTLERLLADQNNEFKFTVSWSDDDNRYEFVRVIRGAELQSLLAGDSISLGEFKTHPDGTGASAPTYNFSVSVELTDAAAKYINTSYFFDGTYVLLPASEQTEWVKGKKSGELEFYRVLPREVTASLVSRPGSVFPQDLTGAFLRDDTSIMHPRRPTVTLVNGSATARFDDNEYQPGDERAIKFVLTGDIGDHIVSSGNRQFVYTTTTDLYSGTTVKLFEKVQTVFKNPDGQSFGMIESDRGEEGSTADRMVLSSFYGWALIYPRVTMKTDPVSSQYVFVGFDPKLTNQSVFDDTTEYVAQYKEKAVVVVPEPDGTVPNPEPGYMRVTFDAVQGKGYFGTAQNKTHKLYLDVYPGVDKAAVMAKVPSVQPETGFVYTGWTPELPDTFSDTGATTFTATYNESAAISPVPLPGYVKVTFTADTAEATLSLPEEPESAAKFTQDGGSFVVYVNPDKNITFSTLVKPRVSLQTGYVLAENPWKLVDPQSVAGDEVKENRVYKVATTRLADSIPAADKDGKPLDKDGNPIPDGDTQTQPVQKPAGYVMVSFDPTAEAAIQTGYSKYYVNPKAAKTLDTLPAPTVVAKSGEKMIANPAWSLTDPAVVAQVEIKEDRSYRANVVEKVKVVVPEPDGNVPVPETRYIRVTFDAVSGKGYFGDAQNKSHIVYLDVYPGADKATVLTKVPTPQTETGFIYAGWTPELPATFNKATTFTAVYTEILPVTPVTPVDPDQPFNPEDDDDPNNSQQTPQGFVRVVFNAGEGSFGTYANGKSIKKLAYDVRGDMTWETFKTQVPTLINAPSQKRFVGWDPALPADDVRVTAGVYVAQFENASQQSQTTSTSQKPQRRLPRSGEAVSLVAPFVIAGVVLAGVGSALVVLKRKNGRSE